MEGFVKGGIQGDGGKAGSRFVKSRSNSAGISWSCYAALCLSSIWLEKLQLYKTYRHYNSVWATFTMKKYQHNTYILSCKNEMFGFKS